MDTNKILSSDLLDLVFDDRNKSYGAYDLRKTYPERVKKSLLITAAIASIVFGGAVLGNTLKPAKAPAEKTGGVIIKELPIPEIKEPEPVPPPAKKPEIPPARIEQFTTLRITEKDVIDPPPSKDELDIAGIGKEDVDGPDDVGLQEPDKKLTGGTGIIEKKEDDNLPRETVEIPARYDGNWEKFLLKYLNGNVPVNNGASVGRYKVIIQFVVDKDGRVSDLVPLTNVGFGMEQEAMRVLKKADKWKPGIQNGYPVKAYHRQVIIFDVGEE